MNKIYLVKTINFVYNDANAFEIPIDKIFSMMYNKSIFLYPYASSDAGKLIFFDPQDRQKNPCWADGTRAFVENRVFKIKSEVMKKGKELHAIPCGKKFKIQQ